MQRQFFSKGILGGLVIAITWLILFAVGFPLAFVDDLYFIGPALNLAKGAGFANPYCPSIAFIDPDYASEFFVYVPLHAHVLALWLMAFGTSTWSLIFFQCLAGAMATWGLERLARPYLSHAASCFILSLCVALFLGQCGLRPEALGLAFFCWGLVLLHPATLFTWTLGCLSLFASCITSPNLGVLVPLVLGVAIYNHYRSEERPVFIRRFGLMMAAGIVIFILFLALIDFKLGHFFFIFNKARVVGATAPATLSNYFTYSLRGPRYMFRFATLAIFPYLALLLVLGLAGWRRRFFIGTISSRELVLAGVGGILLLIPANSSGTGFGLPSFYSLLVCLYYLSRLKNHCLVSYGAYAVFFALMFRANGNFLVQVFSSHLAPPTESPAAILAELKRTPSGPIYMDNFALRSVFDYRIPPDGLDYGFGDTSHFMPPHDPANYPAGSIIVASRQTLGDKSRPSMLTVPWIGFLLPDAPPNPYDCVIVRGGTK